MRRVSVLIPTYNEEANVVPLHDELCACFAENLPDYTYDIIFIDNKSTDNTRNLLRNLCSKDSNTKAIFNIMNFGQFNSPYYGLCQTTGDCSILMCADFQDPIPMIPQMIHKWEEGYKVICAIKKTSKESKVLYFMRSMYYRAIKKMSPVKQIEHFTGFGLYDKSFINVLQNLHDPMPFLRGVVAEFAPDHYEIPYEQQKRRAGKTHNNWYTLYDAAMLSFTSYTKIGLRLAVFIGFLVAAVSILIGLVYLAMKLVMWDRFIAGQAPQMIGMFFLGGVQLFFIGLIGEYIMSINNRVMNRPLVVEEERINFK